MAIRKALALISGRNRVIPTADRLTNVGATYNGIVRKESSEYDTWLGSGTTDANGRVTVNLTVDGTSTGVALFSSVVYGNATTYSASTNLSLLPNFYIESVSANFKQVVFRGIASQAGLVILGIGISQAAFVGSGIPALVQVIGLPA